MMKKQKTIKKIFALVLCLMMMASLVVVANAATYATTFSFSLQSGGGNASAPSVKKTNTYSYASIDFTSYSNKSSYDVVYRLRSSTNNNMASDLSTLYSASKRYPSYWSGYGQKNYAYYFKIQTDTSSAYNASVKGSWNS